MSDPTKEGESLVDPLEAAGLSDLGIGVPEELRKTLQWQSLKNIKKSEKAALAMLAGAQKMFALLESDPEIANRAAVMLTREIFFESSEVTRRRLAKAVEVEKLPQEEKDEAREALEARWEAEDRAKSERTEETIIEDVQRILTLARNTANEN